MLPATVGCLILILSVSGFAQTNSWEELRGEGKKAQKEARYADAEMYFRAARDEAQRLGTSNPRLLTSLNDLAEMFQVQGRYGDANEYLVRVLTLKQEALGFASPEIVPALEALASNQLVLKKQYEVQALLRQSLNILEKTYGTEASE
jgi:tetratricopeptide (TPR) repeat protein